MLTCEVSGNNSALLNRDAVLMITKARVSLALANAHSEALGLVRIHSEKGGKPWVVASERCAKGKIKLAPFTTSISFGMKAPNNAVGIDVSTVDGIARGTMLILSQRIDLDSKTSPFR
eukprot:3364524-Pyramimonas_sp.AAC.1